MGTSLRYLDAFGGPSKKLIDTDHNRKRLLYAKFTAIKKRLKQIDPCTKAQRGTTLPQRKRYCGETLYKKVKAKHIQTVVFNASVRPPDDVVSYITHSSSSNITRVQTDSVTILSTNVDSLKEKVVIAKK